MRNRLETERLVLRLPEREDAGAIVTYYLENRAHLEPWSPSWPAGFFTEAFWRDQVRLCRSELDAGTAVRFLLFPRDRPGRVIGNLSLTQVHRGPAQHCVMGYGIAAAEEGKGLIGEAVKAAVGHAFSDLGLHRVMANYMPHNVRSAAVLRRAGFVVEGYARDYLLIAGRWEDHVLTATTNPGWRQ